MLLGNLLYCEFDEDCGDDYDDGGDGDAGNDEDNYGDDDDDKDVEDNDDEMIPVEVPRVAPWLGKWSRCWSSQGREGL